MDSYRAEKRAMEKILLPDEDGEVDPVPMQGGGGLAEPEMDLLSNILREFNERFGGLDWEDSDRVGRLIAADIPAQVAADPAFRNACGNPDRENARIEHDQALQRVVTALMKDDSEFFRRFVDDPDFRRFVAAKSFLVAFAQANS